MRERLIELISQCNAKNLNMVQLLESEKLLLADHLLANGVIVPPCKVGDKLYYIPFGKTIEECMVHAVECEENTIIVKCHLWRKEREAMLHKHLVYFNTDDFGKTVFLTREEAEKALEGGKE